MFLQLPDRGQHFLMRGHHRRPEAGILQRLRAADGVAERGGGLIQAVHAKVLGHALQRVAGTEGQLPVLGGQRVLQLAEAGVAGVFQQEYAKVTFSCWAMSCSSS